MTEHTPGLDEPERKRRFQLSKWWLRLLGLLVFALILMRLDVVSLGRTLAKADFALLLLSVPFFIPAFLVRSIRLRIILREQGYRVSVGALFVFNVAGFYIGSVTPGQLGTFVRVFYLQEEGVSTAAGLLGLLLERVWEVLAIGTVGTLAYVLVTPEIDRGTVALLALGALTAAGWFLWLASRPGWDDRIAGWARRLLPDRISARTVPWIQGFIRAFSTVTWRTALVSLFLTFVATALVYIRFHILILALHIDLSFLHMSAFVALSQLVALLPVTFSGIGTRDAILVYLFGSVGLAPEQAVAFSVLILLSYAINALAGLAAWLSRPIDYRRAQPRPK